MTPKRKQYPKLSWVTKHSHFSIVRGRHPAGKEIQSYRELLIQRRGGGLQRGGADLQSFSLCYFFEGRIIPPRVTSS